MVAKEYEMKILDEQLRLAYIRKALSIQKQVPIKVGSVDALRKRHGALKKF